MKIIFSTESLVVTFKGSQKTFNNTTSGFSDALKWAWQLAYA